eukprot:4298089-Amphidinium_carterae.1
MDRKTKSFSGPKHVHHERCKLRLVTMKFTSPAQSHSRENVVKIGGLGLSQVGVFAIFGELWGVPIKRRSQSMPLGIFEEDMPDDLSAQDVAGTTDL